MTTLYPFLSFDPEETPISFATRLAALHTGSSAIPFLRDIEVKALELLACKDSALAHLAEISGVDLVDLERNAARSMGKRWFNLRGHVLSSEFFASPYTTFCPACLRDDDQLGVNPALARRGRLMWTLRPVRTCPVHGLMLMRRKNLNWEDQLRQMAQRVPERSAALDAMIGDAIHCVPSPLQDYVVGRLTGKTGAAWLDSQTLEQCVRATAARQSR